MRLVLTPLFFMAIAAAAGVYAGPAAGIDELRRPVSAHVAVAAELPVIAAR